MSKPDPTKDPEFKRVLSNLLKAPPKPHSEMKIGNPKGKSAQSLGARKAKTRAKK
jgi:hypothetical protein